MVNVSLDKFSLIYPYKKIQGIYRPTIPVMFKYSGKETEIKVGIVDTGSDTILIKHRTAKHLKIQIAEKDWKESDSPAGKFRTGKVNVDFMIIHSKGIKLFQDIKIRVSEIDNYPPDPLIGINPLFNEYNIFFDNVNKMCHLIPK